MNKSSNWTALRNPAFRKLWIATVISRTCVAAHDRAATWMMIADVNRGVACPVPSSNSGIDAGCGLP